MNYMGGRFTTEPSAMQAFLEDIASRGLIYVEDGSSPRSLAGDLARQVRAPVVTADLVLDRSRDLDDIRAELRNLEALARSEGLAIGVASAFPVSVEAIAAWAADAAGRGLALVPVSAALDH